MKYNEFANIKLTFLSMAKAAHALDSDASTEEINAKLKERSDVNDDLLMALHWLYNVVWEHIEDEIQANPTVDNIASLIYREINKGA